MQGASERADAVGMWESAAVEQFRKLFSEDLDGQKAENDSNTMILR